MKRSSLCRAIWLLAATLLFFAGCGNDNKTSTETVVTPTAQNAPTASSQTTVTPEEAKGLKGLSLTVDKINLNKDENTTVKVIATYENGSSKEVTEKVAWQVIPSDAVSIKSNTLTAINDGNATLQAKVGNTLSNKVTLNIYWEVNGHRLPPEPDKALNNATLLGIDSNNNGVRDDVERWIYEEYKDKHPIYIDIAMQAARGYRLVLEHPERAKEIYPKVDKAIDCQAYYKYSAKYYGDPILIKNNAVDEYFRSSVYFNTKERMDAYNQYDTLLSGDSYTLPSDKERKAACDFNTSKYEE